MISYNKNCVDIIVFHNIINVKRNIYKFKFFSKYDAETGFLETKVFKSAFAFTKLGNKEDSVITRSYKSNFFSR